MKPMIEFFYWCAVLESWVQCTADDYMREHYGKSFTKIREVYPDDNRRLADAGRAVGDRGAGVRGPQPVDPQA